MKILKEEQMTFMRYDLEELVRENHVLRKINTLINFKILARNHKNLATTVGRKGYGVEVGIRSLLLQFYYDLSDRQLEERLTDDIAFRWFCGFNLDEATADHTYFCRIRKALGTKGIGDIFKRIVTESKKNNLIKNIFTFVDSSTIIAKETTWTERDKALAAKETTINNTNISKYSADKDARFGCKGKNKFWFGYKRHSAVDMGSGIITKVVATPANISDVHGLYHICPWESMVCADKGYVTKACELLLQSWHCYSGIIRKNNMKDKNKDKDRWLTKLRAPFENIFSHTKKRTRYKGLAKIQMQVFLEALVFNIKRLLVLGVERLFCYQ